MRRSAVAALVAMLAAGSLSSVHAWGGQGHRLVGLIAARHLTPVAKQNVAWLLDGRSLADVSSWADSLTSDQVQTSYWHYLNNDPAKPFPCDLHSVWDSRLIARRALNDAAYVAVLEKLIAERKWAGQAPGTPAEWAEQSWALAKKALVAPDTNIDEAYYRAHLPVIDERLALGAVRLAAVLNRIFVAAP